MATDHEQPGALDKSVNRKEDSTHLPTLAPETMAVGPERPRESREEEGGDVRPRRWMTVSRSLGTMPVKRDGK